MAHELNGQALPLHHTKPHKIGALTKLGLYFHWCVGFIYVFDQTLAEQLYRDKVFLDGSLRPKFPLDPVTLILIKSRVWPTLVSKNFSTRLGQS